MGALGTLPWIVIGHILKSLDNDQGPPKSEGLTLSRIKKYNKDVIHDIQSAYLVITTIM